jgi:hypothetical protein
VDFFDRPAAFIFCFLRHHFSPKDLEYSNKSQGEETQGEETCIGTQSCEKPEGGYVSGQP